MTTHRQAQGRLVAAFYKTAPNTPERVAALAALTAHRRAFGLLV